MRTCSVGQRTLLNAVWGPEWEENPKKKGCKCTYC